MVQFFSGGFFPYYNNDEFSVQPGCDKYNDYVTQGISSFLQHLHLNLDLHCNEK